MNEKTTPENNSFIARLDAAVQQVKRDPRCMMEYVRLRLTEDGTPQAEIDEFLASDRALEMLARGTQRTVAEVAQILGRDIPKNSAEV